MCRALLFNILCLLWITVCNMREESLHLSFSITNLLNGDNSFHKDCFVSRILRSSVGTTGSHTSLHQIQMATYQNTKSAWQRSTVFPFHVQIFIVISRSVPLITDNTEAQSCNVWWTWRQRTTFSTLTVILNAFKLRAGLAPKRPVWNILHTKRLHTTMEFSLKLNLTKGWSETRRRSRGVKRDLMRSEKWWERGWRERPLRFGPAFEAYPNWQRRNGPGDNVFPQPHPTSCCESHKRDLKCPISM